VEDGDEVVKGSSQYGNASTGCCSDAGDFEQGSFLNFICAVLLHGL
jgi:hypothetical protein